MKTLTPTQAKALKPGALLKVISDSNSSGHLKKGTTVKFRKLWNDAGTEIFVEGSSWSWLVKRFAVVGATRDARGRFAPVTPTAQKLRQKPQALRPGSLYAVKRKRGYQIARLRSVAHKDFLVFSRHEKPFVARREQVALADKDEVQSYLAEAGK